MKQRPISGRRGNNTYSHGPVISGGSDGGKLTGQVGTFIIWKILYIICHRVNGYLFENQSFDIEKPCIE